MKKYKIDFFKCFTYYVEAGTEDEAIEIAEDEFCDDMCYPIADATYDDMEMEEI